MATSLRVVLVEDEEELRKLTASQLNLQADLECIATFRTAEEFEAALPSLRPDAVLMDIGLPGKSGILSVVSSLEKYPNLLFIMFTTHTEEEEIVDAMTAGAVSYVLKHQPIEQIALTIREARNGLSVMSRAIARVVYGRLQGRPSLLPGTETLTNRELEVLERLKKGMTYKEIAEELNISDQTVRTHIRNIYRKLQINRRSDLF